MEMEREEDRKEKEEGERLEGVEKNNECVLPVSTHIRLPFK